MAVHSRKCQDTLSHQCVAVCLCIFGLYVFAAAKYAVNDYLGEQANTYFSTIFIPTSVINMMAGFVIRPVLTKLSLYFAEKRRKEFRQLVLKIAGLILGLTVFSMGAAAVLGIPVLSILLGSAGKILLPIQWHWCW